MRLEGIHHITAITENAQRNVDFYAGVMGLRLVKKTVNQDNPTVYHLFFADEAGDPGADLTFFEYPGAAPGRAGVGMVHRIVWRVGAPESLDFWEGRLGALDIATRREGDSLHFSDPEGLDHELLVADVPDAPLIADHPEVPRELALQGFHAVRAYAAAPDTSSALLEALEFEATEAGWEARGADRGQRPGAGRVRQPELRPRSLWAGLVRSPGRPASGPARLSRRARNTPSRPVRRDLPFLVFGSDPGFLAAGR